MTRSGYINAYGTDAPACSPSSSPRFHHDNANSGDYSRDAVRRARRRSWKSRTAAHRSSFRAPGDDLLCGTVDHYEFVTSKRPIDEQSFADAKPLGGAPEPKAAGGKQKLDVPGKSKGWVAIRAVDEQGNVGRPASVDFRGAPVQTPDDPDDPSGGPCSKRIAGTDGVDRLVGSIASERIVGRGGKDRIRGGGGDDCIAGGGGKDRINGDDGDDKLTGQKGNDRVSGGNGDDRVRGGDGNDRLKGGNGDDRIQGKGGRDKISGGGGDDVLRAGQRPDRVSGGAGNDSIETVGGGADIVHCGSGKDSVRAGRSDRVAKNCEKVRRR